MKREIIVDVGFYFNWSCIEIGDLMEDLLKLEKLGATVIEIEPYDDYGDLHIRFNAYMRRLETDEEYEVRIHREKREIESVRRKELAQLEFLKSKYENNQPVIKK